MFRLLTVALLACVPLVGSEQVHSSESEPNIAFSTAAFSDDLTQKSITESFQDSTGAIWFVTQEGINRYNGHELEIFRYSLTKPSSLSSDDVTGIAEDNDGFLWVSTRGGGLNRYNPMSNKFEHHFADTASQDSPFSNDIHSILIDSKNMVWLGYENAFSVFNPATMDFRHYIPNGNDIPSLGEIRGFTETPDGALWAATQKAGVIKIDPVTHQVTTIRHHPSRADSLVSDEIVDVLADRSGKIWALSNDEGVSVIDPSDHSVQNYQNNTADNRSLSSNATIDVFEDHQGRIWIGTREGLNLFNRTTNTFWRYSVAGTDLEFDLVTSIYQSRDGQYWIGTYNGLAVGTPTLFATFDTHYGRLSDDAINAFAETSDGSFWVGTDDGLNRLKSGNETFEWINEYTYPAISSATVMSMLGEESVLWVGTFNGGLNRLDIESKEVEVFRHSPLKPSTIAANGITSIIRGLDSRLYVGTFGGGLSIYDPENKSFINFSHDPQDISSISSNRVIALFQDSLGDIWIGTENGLNRFEPHSRTFKRIYSERGNTDSISSDMVWAFHEDSKQRLWIGTSGGGLNRWDVEDRARGNELFYHYSDNISLPSSDIYGIQQDAAGKLWLSHNSGITRLDPETGETRHFGIRDGLQDTEFNFGASFKAKEGLIYFGGNRGYNVIDYRSLTEEKSPPQVSIAEIRIMNERREFDKPYDRLKTLDLAYTDSMVSVEFFAANYRNPALTKYAYMLDGINTDWVVSDASRIATFTTLPPGNYTLKLAAATADGVWNWDGASLAITVAPPPWLSTPAYVGYVALSSIALFAFFSQQRRKEAAALHRQRELEFKVQERTADLDEARKAAEAANKAKSDFLATMSHEIRTPMHGMIGMTDLLLHTNLTEQQKTFAQAAHKSGESLLNLINEILDFSKAEAAKVELELKEFDLAKVIEEVCYLQAEPANKKDLSVNNIIDPSLPSAFMGDPTKIRQILTNLVSNAIKFTPEGVINVLVSVSQTEGPDGFYTRITVSDSGIGMNEVTLQRIFDPFTQADASTTREYGGTGLGLSISKSYVELMGGMISVQSEPGNGTTIHVDLPLTQIQPRTAERRFLKMTCAIFCTDSYRSEMALCQLKRLGLTTSHYSELAGFVADINTFDLVCIDQKSFNQQNLKDARIQQIRNGFLLTPIDMTTPDPEVPGWPTVACPISQQGIVEAISKLVARPKVNAKTAAGKTDNKATSINILVAEDVETNQRIAKEMIQMLGCQVTVANNGAEAVELYQAQNFDLVFMDCQMPVMDGFDATQGIRDFEAITGAAKTPIVALTAGISPKDESKARNSGMDLFLTKPYTVDDLKSVFNQFLDFTTPPLSDTDAPPIEPTKQDSSDGSLVQGALLMSAIENIREVERQTGNKILPSIFNGFISQMDEKLSELRDHIAASTMGEIYRAAHAIKSMSANIGAEKVRTVAAKIEKSGREETIEDYPALFDELDHEYQRFVRVFTDEIMHEENDVTIHFAEEAK